MGDIQTIDGRPAPKGQQLTGPFLFGGGFSSILVEIFSPENSRYFNYKVMGADKVDDNLRCLLNLKRKKTRTRCYIENCLARSM